MNSQKVIGYYVNHGGKGHLNRALAIIPHLPCVVILFGSFVPGSFDLPDNTTFVELPDDAVPGYQVVLGQPYLYTPWGTNVHKRYQMVLDAIIKYNITHMHSDVSPEIVSFAKIMGLTTSTILMQGIRIDRAHTLGYEMANTVVAPFIPRYVDMDNYRIDKKVQFVGGISRFAGQMNRPIKARNMLGWKGTNVLITTSFGGEAKDTRLLVGAAKLLPNITWHIIGNFKNARRLPANVRCYREIANPAEYVQAADYVIGSGGYNSIMEAAQFSKKYACFPETRPYVEQVTAASALTRLHAAVVIDAYPQTFEQWQELFTEMDNVDLKSFHALVAPDAAERMARAITSAGLKQR